MNIYCNDKYPGDDIPLKKTKPKTKNKSKQNKKPNKKQARKPQEVHLLLYEIVNESDLTKHNVWTKIDNQALDKAMRDFSAVLAKTVSKPVPRLWDRKM